MKLRVEREWETDKSVCGKLYADGQFECFTLEPARVNPVHPGHPCIEAGTFNLLLTPSPHLGYITPELLAVPGRTDIRIHIGNYPKDSLGCMLVGETHSTDMVGNSHDAFASLMLLFRHAISASEPLTIEIVDPPRLSTL